MQRLLIILFLAFILMMGVSIFILNTMRQDLTEIPEAKKELKAELPSKIPTETRSLKELEKPLEWPTTTTVPSAMIKEKEYNLDEIPIDEAKEVERKNREESQETTEASDRRLNTQPPIDKLKELNVKGAIIY